MPGSARLAGGTPGPTGFAEPIAAVAASQSQLTPHLRRLDPRPCPLHQKGLMAPVEITDPYDPRIAVFRDVRERDLSGRLGGFIAEGEVVLRVLARSRLHRTRSVLIAARRLEKLSAILALFGPEVAIHTASQEVMDAIAGFHIHRGILAWGERGPSRPPAEVLAGCAPRAIVLVLVGLSNHDNMGGVFRNAAAFGADAVLLDPTCCDPLYRKSIRVSVGAALAVPFARLGAGEDVLGLLDRAGFTALALSPAGQTRLCDLARPTRTAVLLGTEGPGLPEDLLARARSISIPMAGDFDSLNVATTSGIVLHHLVSAG